MLQGYRYRYLRARERLALPLRIEGLLLQPLPLAASFLTWAVTEHDCGLQDWGAP